MQHAGTSAGLEAHVAHAIRDSDARIVVTGASGWIGMATLDLLRAALGRAFASRVHCFGSNSRALEMSDGATVKQKPLADIACLPAAPTIVLHLAFLTKDRAQTMDEAEYRAANRALDQAVVEALGPIGAEAVFVASSGAAYRSADPSASPSMQLYGTLKAEQEERFAHWARRYDKRTVIARIFNISGPCINKHASYALSSFIMDALARRPISISATRPVVRSYVAVRELMSTVFALLIGGTQGAVTRFDTGGEPMEMNDIATVVSRLLGPIAIERPPLNQAEPDRYVGDSAGYDRLRAELGIEPVSFERQVIETADFLARFQSQLGADRVVIEQRSC